MEYKFRIKEFLDRLPRSEYKKAMKELPEILNIHPVSFSRLINTRKESRYKPDWEIIYKLSIYFNVKEIDIYTEIPNAYPDEIFKMDELLIASNLDLSI